MSTDIDKSYSIIAMPPSVEDYLWICKQSGLSEKTREAAVIGLSNSIFSVTLLFKDKAIGMGRIIGDGGCFYQIVDIAIIPEHQGKGLGKLIMQHLIEFLDNNAPRSAYVSLIADLPADKLYGQFGFTYTTPKSVGMYKKY